MMVEQMHLDKEDPVNPSHYDGDACMKAIEECTKGLDGPEGYLTGVIIKYLWRWKQKNGIEDLKKAEWYLHRLMNNVTYTDGRPEQDPMVVNMTQEEFDKQQASVAQTGMTINCAVCREPMRFRETPVNGKFYCGQCTTGHDIRTTSDGIISINPITR